MNDPSSRAHLVHEVGGWGEKILCFSRGPSDLSVGFEADEDEKKQFLGILSGTAKQI